MLLDRQKLLGGWQDCYGGYDVASESARARPPVSRAHPILEFFHELLSTRFDVTVFLSASDVTECLRQVRDHAPDILILWQVSFRARALIALGLPTVWVPMYDQSRRRWHQNYLEAAQAGAGVIAFCREVGRFAGSRSLPSLSVQYYPVPSTQAGYEANENRLLLWYRGAIQPRGLWPMLKEIPDLKVVIKHDVDPGAPGAARDDGPLAPHIERVIEGFVPADEYADLTGVTVEFAAPRRKEGIGLSFLDAMARGAFVLGYDSPTMSKSHSPCRDRLAV